MINTFFVVVLSTLIEPKFDLTNRVVFPKNFLHIARKNKNYLPEKISIWGSTSNGVILALLKLRAGQFINAVIEIKLEKKEAFASYWIIGLIACRGNEYPS